MTQIISSGSQQRVGEIVASLISKGTLFKEGLRLKEQAKIDCGRRHFQALGNGVQYTLADNFDAFASNYLNAGG